MIEKKSERLEIRLGYTEKGAFVDACETQGDTPSGAIRRFIAGYVRRSDGDLIGEANRRLFRRYGLGITLGALAFAVAGIVVFAGERGLFLPSITDAQLFEARDINGDGELSLGEHGLVPNPDGSRNGVLRVLDLDSSDTISRDEFVAQGRMIYAVQNRDDAVMDENGESVPMTLVTFVFESGRTRSGTFTGTPIDANALDRLVIWYGDGTNTVFEGNIDIDTGDGLSVTSERVTFPSSVNVDKSDDGTVKATRG